jgi:hypothetical protein
MTSKFVEGILCPGGEDTEPVPVAVGGLESLQGFVGGLIDAVSKPFTPSDLYGDEVPEGATEFTAVGYVNDEGILLGLELNELASTVFQRELYGPVVVVSGTSPSGAYDGENYGLPTWFADAVCNGSLRDAVELSKQLAVIARALAVAVRDDLITIDEVKLAWVLANVGHEESQVLIATLCAYGEARLDTEVSEETEQVEWSVTDEEIALFLDQNGGK